MALVVVFTILYKRNKPLFSYAINIYFSEAVPGSQMQVSLKLMEFAQ